MEQYLRREWIETNGLGGYAFGTANGFPTRRYHGLLIAARRPPVDRRLLFWGVLASFEPGGHEVALDPGPAGPKGGCRTEFSLAPFPTTTYRLPSHGILLTRTVFMRHGHNITVLRYRLGPSSCPMRLALRILPALRDHHVISGGSSAGGAPAPRRIVSEIVGRRCVRFSKGNDDAFVFHSAGEFVADPKTVGPFHYLWETRQGMDDTEIFYSPGKIVAKLTASRGLDLILSDRLLARPDPGRWQQAERARRRQIAAGPGCRGDAGPILRTLRMAADQFLVARGGRRRRRTIVAGYPWFTDWGRDTMISIEGLTLARGEYAAAREILAAFAAAESRGMIPNHYPDAGAEPRYNTVDASLWFFEAGRKFLDDSKDISFVRKTLYPVFRSILRHHMAGTRFNIHADAATGLLFSGAEGTQLTWMDAKVEDWVVTPRHGYPVEIQALWYNALRIFAELSNLFRVRDRTAANADRTADLCKRTFLEKFWNEKKGCLIDCITPEGKLVPDVRPNQILAMSLTHPILTDRGRGKKILALVRKKLLTPFGLRTLSPDHPDYRGRHEGSRRRRDAAYHQGTVWPWLLGPYGRACLRMDGCTRKTRSHIFRILRGFQGHLQTCAMGTVSEIFDGDPPHEPKGCVAQAWSVAELLALADAAAFGLNRRAEG